MALTLEEIKTYVPELKDKPVNEIIAVMEQHGFDTSAIAQEETAQPEESGLLRSYVGTPILKGIEGANQAIGYGLEASGIAPETGRAMQESADERIRTLTSHQSQQAQEDAQKKLIDENGNYGGYNLGTLSQQAFESAPGMAAMALPGGLLTKALTPIAGGLVGSSIGFGASEGAFSGAQNASQIQQEIRSADFETLLQHPEFKRTVEQETSPALSMDDRLMIARDIVARKAGDQVFADTFVKTGGISSVTGGGMLGALGRGGYTGGLATRMAKGFGNEGILQEAPQSALEQQTINQAKKDYLNPNQDTNEGVLTSGLEGGLVGGVLGAAGGFKANVGDIAKAPTVDDAIKAASDAVEGGSTADEAINRLRSEKQKDIPPSSEMDFAEANRLLAERIKSDNTIPGQPIQQAIDQQFQDTGYKPMGMETPEFKIKPRWTTPNGEQAQVQADKNRAFYEAEQAAIQQKQDDLAAMEHNPDASPAQVKQYRKKRIELQLQKRKNADLFRQGLGFNIVPMQAGEVKNDQLSTQLTRALNEQKVTEATGSGTGGSLRGLGDGKRIPPVVTRKRRLESLDDGTVGLPSGLPEQDQRAEGSDLLSASRGVGSLDEIPTQQLVSRTETSAMPSKETVQPIPETGFKADQVAGINQSSNDAVQDADILAPQPAAQDANPPAARTPAPSVPEAQAEPMVAPKAEDYKSAAEYHAARLAFKKNQPANNEQQIEKNKRLNELNGEIKKAKSLLEKRQTKGDKAFSPAQARLDAKLIKEAEDKLTWLEDERNKLVSPQLDSILTVSKKRYLSDQKRAYNKANPNAIKSAKDKAYADIERNYEDELLKAEVSLPFEQYRQRNPDLTENLARQTYDQVRGELGIDEKKTGIEAETTYTDEPEFRQSRNNDNTVRKGKDKKSNTVTDSDDLLAAIAKLGGLKRDEAKAQGIDPASFNKRGYGIMRVFTKGGKSYDEMAELLRGYYFDAPTANDLVDQVSRAINQGEKIYTPVGYEIKAELMAQEHLNDNEAKKVLHYQSLLETAKQHDMDFGTNYLDILLAKEDLAYDDISAWEEDLNDDRQDRLKESVANSEETLSSYTEQDIKDREQADKQRAKQESVDKVKSQADKEIDSVFDEIAGTDPKAADVFGMSDPLEKISEPEEKPDAARFRKEDIPYETAYRAYAGISFDPQKRAKSTQEEYVNYMQSVYDDVIKIAKNDEQRAVIDAAFDNYRRGYIQKQLAHLQAKSRVLSPMIAGPANFPVRRNEKANNTEHKRLEEFIEWDKKARGRLKEIALGTRSQEEIQDDRFRTIKNKLESSLSTIKGIDDGTVRGSSRPLFVSSITGTIKTLARNGQSDLVNKALDYIADYQKDLKKPLITPQNAIWTLRNQIAENQEPVAKPSGTELIKAYQGAEIVNNHDAERVQILFDEKPSEEIRTALKKEAFKWSPSNSAWQRQNTPNGIAAAKRVLNSLFSEKPEAAKKSQTQRKGGLTKVQVLAHIAKKYRKLKPLVDNGTVVVYDTFEDVPVEIRGEGMSSIQAWHGSPHDHMGFKADNIGTGEGAQAFGYGHYFTNKKDIAEWYRNKLAGNDPTKVRLGDKEYGYIGDNKRELIKALKDSGVPVVNAIAAVQELQNHNGLFNATAAFSWSAEDEPQAKEAYREKILNALSKLEEVPAKGKLYQVELAPNDDELLDWDKPLSEQSDKVKSAINKMLNDKEFISTLDQSKGTRDFVTGVKGLSDEQFFKKYIDRGYSVKDGRLYNRKGEMLPDSAVKSQRDMDESKQVYRDAGHMYRDMAHMLGYDAQASDYLHSLGIRGIRYQAEGGKSGAYNYVIFADDDISIKAKYSQNPVKIEGFTYKGKIYLIADALSPETIDGVIHHEFFHKVIAENPKIRNRLLGAQSDLRGIMRQVEAGRYRGRYKEIYDAAMDRAKKAGTASEQEKLEEFLAYSVSKYLENPQSLPERLARIIKDIIAAIKLAIFKMTGKITDISPADLTAMARSSMRVSEDGGGGMKSSKLALPDKITIDGVERWTVNSNGQSIAQTEEGIRNFWKWFGDSKVVDDQGRPLVVYHGTDKKFNKINFKKSYQPIFWFSSDKEKILSGDAGAKATSVLMELYVKLDSPANRKQYNDLTLSEYKGRGLDGAILEGGNGFVMNQSQIKSATGNTGAFDPNNNDIRYSLAEDTAREELNRRIREQHKTVSDRAKQWFTREFHPGGALPKAVFTLKVARDSEINAEELIAHNLVAMLDKSVKTAWGGRMTEEQKQLVGARLKGEEVSLPASVKDSIDAMRLHIDKLSARYADILFKEAEELQAADKTEAAAAKVQLLNTIANNIGSYVNRSYRAFDNENWAKQVPDDVLNNARDYLEERFRSKGSVTPIADAQRTINDILKTGTAYDTFEQYIRESKLGAKDLSVLIKRKDIAPEIRALLGEYTDPRINFVKSATKMSRLIFNDDFLKQVKTTGLGADGFLFTKDNRPADEHTVKIAADSSSPMAPLNGLYTYPEINQAFVDALNKESMESWYRMIVQANGLVKYGKTVLSPTTSFRNWMSAYFFTLANGHFDLSHMKESIESFKTYFDQDNGRLHYLEKLKRLGVIYDTPYAGEMMALLADSKFESALMGEDGRFSKAKLKVKDWMDLATKFYQFGDDFWKIIGFENEKQILKKYRGLTDAQAEVEAAKRIRNTYPTYSMVGRMIQKLRRFPLVGTFVSFPAEIIRTSFNILKYAKEDMAYSKELGMRRIAGIAMVSGFAYAAQALAMSLTGTDDHDEEALRDLAPPWSKNSNIIPMGRDKNGSLIYIDMSFLDPYNYFKRPLNAILRGQPIDETAYEIGREILTPFFGQDIAFGAISDIWQNKKDSGGQVFNPNDSALNIGVDIANHLRKNLQPGIVSNMERMTYALTGHKSTSGQTNTVAEELAALAGFRASRVNPKVALYYRSYEFQDKLKDASKILNDVARDPNRVSDSRLKSAYERAIETRSEAFKDMHELVSSAENAGLSKAAIRKLLKLNHVSQKNINFILLGKEPKWVPGETFLKSSIAKSDELFDAETTKEFERRRKLILSGKE